MVCCTRISSNLLSKIRNYANEHHKLFFLEALFPTICKVNNMKYDKPTELINVDYEKKYKYSDIDKNNIFHPEKKIDMHKYYRDKLNNKLNFYLYLK
jgi:hypothetical protein